MARLFLLLLWLCTSATALVAQAPASAVTSPAAAVAAQPSSGTPGSDVVLLFVRADAADALQQSTVINTSVWTVFKETGPLAAKGRPALYALFPRDSSLQSATSSAEVIKAATSYLAQRGANRLELAPVVDCRCRCRCQW